MAEFEYFGTTLLKKQELQVLTSGMIHFETFLDVKPGLSSWGRSTEWYHSETVLGTVFQCYRHQETR